MVVPTDPLYASQWHLDLIGDLERLWDQYTGAGVRVVVFDDGLETTHADLNDNYDASNPFVTVAGVHNPMSGTAHGWHGTAVAGIIAAEAMNGRGGVGVAWGASLTGLNYLDDLQLADEAVVHAAHLYAGQFDVMNNSWAVTPLYRDAQSLILSDSWARFVTDDFATISQTGRAGLGTVIVQAAGDDFMNANGSGLTSSRHTITVAATNKLGNVISNSNWGACLLISAPAASYTTDRTGSLGFNRTTGSADGDPLNLLDYTSTFGGTSAATGVVSGVVALMLEADPGLGWRDIHNILALSAAHTGSGFGEGVSGSEVGAWIANGATNWNGGGLSYNPSYGFGLVDAAAAVDMAAVWRKMTGTTQTSANEQVVSVSYAGADVVVPDFSTRYVSLAVTREIVVETVMATITLTHPFSSDLNVYLVDPKGNEYGLLLQEGDGQLTASGLQWTFGIEGARGMSSVGVWKLKVQDSVPGDGGTVSGFDLQIYGGEVPGHQIQHITDDFQTYAALESARRNITSTGADDWLNMAGVTGNVAFNLGVGGSFSVDGVTWGTLGAADTFRHVVLGSGNDVIFLGPSTNDIFLGAGDDTVRMTNSTITANGGAGRDYVSYYDSPTGVTIDLLFNTNSGGWADDDRLSDFEGVTGSGTGDDVIYGTNGANTIRTYGGNDKVFDRLGNDYIDLGAGNDFVLAGKGNDTYIGGTGSDYISYYYSAGGVNLNLLYDIASGGDAAGDTINSFESAAGSAVAGDTIYGTNGNNTIRTYGGNDKVFDRLGNDFVELGDGNDFLLAGGGADTFDGGAGADYISYYDSDAGIFVDLMLNLAGGGFAQGNKISGFESAAGSHFGDDTIYGSHGNNTIRTYGGNDKVFDRLGDDFVDLGDGNDFVLVGGGNDTLIGGSGSDYISYYNSSAGVTLDLQKNTASGGLASGDKISGFESAAGSASAADSIYGTNGNNTIRTYGGNDKVYDRLGDDLVELGDGNDFLLAGGGNDRYDGGAGDDYISYYNSPSGVTLDLLLGTASGGMADGDTLVGFEHAAGSATGDDVLWGTPGQNVLRTYGGNDLVYDRSGDDKVELGDGNDTVVAGGGQDSFDGGAGNDYISYYYSTSGVMLDLQTNVVSGGWAWDDSINGFEDAAGSNTGDDTLLGTSGSNYLRGYGGDDLLDGRGGADTLWGGEGEDTLTGGTGADTFVFTPNDGFDTITDFDSAVDLIDLRAFAFATASEVLRTVVADGADLLLLLPDGTTVLFEQHRIGDLSDAHFIL